MTLEASREMRGDDEAATFRMWRTPNLVNNFTTICLAKVTSAQAPYGGTVLTANMAAGVDMARENFAGLSSFGLTFKSATASVSSAGQLTHSIQGCNSTIWVYKVEGGAGGSAGFPSNGSPYAFVLLNSGLAGWSLDTHEHVATHEIGHAIGFRHADWKTRSSCGSLQAESQEGAIQVGGTADQTTSSIMASCFKSDTPGEFIGEDQQALSTVY